MKKISQDAARAFMEARPFNRTNTRVEVLENVTIMYLFGNAIAYRYNDPERTLSVTNAGWFSNTTKERLNAIDGVSVYQRDWNWYLNGEQWNGKLTDVK